MYYTDQIALKSYNPSKQLLKNELKRVDTNAK